MMAGAACPNDDIIHLAQKAVRYDKESRYDAAIYFYRESATAILAAIKTGQLPESHRSQAVSYVERAEELKKKSVEEETAAQHASKTEQQLNVERAEFLLYQALSEDEEGNITEAIALYSEAVELCLATRESVDASSTLSTQLKKLATRALDRAEKLKHKQQQLAASSSTAGSSVNDSVSPTTNLTTGIDRLYVGDGDIPKSSSSGSGGGLSPQLLRQNQAAAPIKSKLSGGAGFSKDELAVLRITSRINNREYVPFMSVDLRERFAYPVPFSDKDGLPPLSEKQKSKLKAWIRPSDIVDQPKIISRIDSGTIKQTIVSDCSFVASLAVSARYENKTGKQLITRCIYPQDKHGRPIYNPCGKYMIKLHLNGVPRKIIIDDRLPIGHYGELLCSHSQQRDELWVSLLEKAYLKVMGGYDFPGSNSNIDLHALTGWIPDRIGIRKSDPDFNADAVFEKLFDRFHKGDCLITLATGKLPKTEQDRAGLVECHAYACLDLRKIQGKRLLMVKNPWTHLRWKGRYSERDAASWTSELRKALEYNPEDAQQFDDGVFWIDYESVLHFFDVFYVNWNTELFPHTYCFHDAWKAGSGPVKDLYTVADNPQYSLEVTNQSSAAVWVLLTRHITDKADFADNKEFITVLVYKTGGKKVYYPFDPRPYIDGTRINSPHYLCKITLPEPGIHRFTLVVAQYEKYNTIYYTMRVYATCEFKMHKIIDKYTHSKQETGSWSGPSAGGCANYRDTYDKNPIYQLTLDQTSDICISLRGPKQYSVGFTIIQVQNKGGAFEKCTSEPYRPGYCVLPLPQMPSGVYNIVPTTFLPKQEAPFFLNVYSTNSIKISRLQ